MQRRSQSGEGRLSFMLSLAVIVIGGMLAWEYLPVRIARAELTDFIDEQTKFATRLPAKQIQRNIYDKAVQLNLPLELKKIKVTKAGGKIRVQVSYMVELDFPGYTHEYYVDETTEKPIFFF